METFDYVEARDIAGAETYGDTHALALEERGPELAHAYADAAGDFE